MSYVTETLSNLIHQTAFFNLTWGNYLMIAVIAAAIAAAEGTSPDGFVVRSIRKVKRGRR